MHIASGGSVRYTSTGDTLGTTAATHLQGWDASDICSQCVAFACSSCFASTGQKHVVRLIDVQKLPIEYHCVHKDWHFLQGASHSCVLGCLGLAPGNPEQDGQDWSINSVLLHPVLGEPQAIHPFAPSQIMQTVWGGLWGMGYEMY